LDKLELGDTAEVIYPDGRRFVYEVTELLIFNPFDPNDPVLENFAESTDSGMVMVTCWPPGGTAQRLAVSMTQI